MAFDLARRAFQHALTQTDDDAVHVVVDGLMHLIDEASSEIELLRAEVAELRERLPKP